MISLDDMLFGSVLPCLLSSGQASVPTVCLKERGAPSTDSQQHSSSSRFQGMRSEAALLASRPACLPSFAGLILCRDVSDVTNILAPVEPSNRQGEVVGSGVFPRPREALGNGWRGPDHSPIVAGEFSELSGVLGRRNISRLLRGSTRPLNVRCGGKKRGRHWSEPEN
ncbi:hypothetical protein F5X68DRAFT_213820 [Plectosphaerella plurivora]|uniref:Uncharacterized protein n=1 Tax=Plectosphaerella plurivora TaxID=936078 RepID=A0A9P9A7E8_9PEZI|nr:hypothetical protein F5X68DRAFT_213820 [Plectosphaerella plurivora]